MRYYSKLFLLFALTLTSNSLFAQEIGRYPLVNFHHRQYNGHSQSWAITQDKRGMIYVANNIGVIEFDGFDWRHISINNALARCLGTDSNGRVWVGGQDEVGYLAADSTNSLKFYSLTKLLPERFAKPGLIRQIYPTDDAVYFSTFQTLFRINKDLTVKYWEPKTQFHRSYFVDNIIFINQRDYGLTYLYNDSLIKVPGCEILGTQLVYTILPYNYRYLLVGTQTNGFYLLDKQALTTQSLPSDFKSLLPFKTSNDDFFVTNRIYSGVMLAEGLWAIGTYSGGVAIINSNGQIVRTISKETGLQDNTAWYLYADNSQNIWMALNNGISYSPFHSQLTSWTEQDGISGVVQSAVNFKGTIYYSSNTGVHYKTNSHFEKVNGINDLSWGLFIYSDESGREHLLSGTSSGIYRIDGKTATPITHSKVNAYSFIKSKIYPGIIYVGLYDGVGVIQENKGKFSFLGYLLKSTAEVYKVAEDKNGDIWFTQRYKGIGFLDIINPYELIAEKYKGYTLPFQPKCDDIAVNYINGVVLASSEGGLSRYDKDTDSFVPETMLGTQYANGTVGLRILTCDRNSDIWFETYRFAANRRLERASKYADNSYRRSPAQFTLIPETIFFDVHTDSNNVTWISSTDGLFRFDANEPFTGNQIPRVFIRQVISKKKGTVYGGCPFDSSALQPFVDLKASQIQESLLLPARANDLIISFSSPYFQPNHQLLFSYKLDGYDEDWNSWTSGRFKEYTNLKPGNYRFMVKSKTLQDTESPIEYFDFTIDHPFYLKWYAFILYLILVGLLIFVIVRVNTRILRVSNIKLQQLVDERTKELKESERALTEKNILLQHQKEEILSQRDELEERNRHINDSIQYAKTIQQAILPDLDTVFANDFEHFLIYLPKEMVSGDFYWVAQAGPKGKPNDKLFVAVVDCTGHGVPGAFMSLIGSRLLSEIVVERKNHNPAAILTELNDEVNKALRQDVSESFDGMDVALCLIERKSDDAYVVTFAGANRPLFYCHKGDNTMQTLKGNRKSIGSVLPDVDQEFSNWRISMHPGDILVMATDGITDQNNTLRKKYTTCRFHTSIITALGKPMQQMQSIILNEFLNFKGEEPQRDDITVLGIRLK
ncbi:MAG: SpoIIE family protein phosphatase [Bacteroidota bacterium]